MKALRFAGLGMLTVIVLVIVVSLFLPGTVHIERSVEIAAPARTVYEQIAALEAWEQWDPWSGRDTSIEMSYTAGDESGVGAKRSWLSDDPNMGSGSLTISRLVPHDSVAVEVDLGYGLPLFGFRLQEADNITKVTWSCDDETTTPPILGKYFGLAMESTLGPDFELGLQNLKGICEAMPKPPAQPIITIEDMEAPIWAVGMLQETAPAEISKTLGESYQAILSYLGITGLEMSGVPLCRYQSYFNPRGNVELEAGAPIADSVAIPDNRFHLMRLGGGRVAKMTFMGPHTQLGSAHKAMGQWLKDNGLTTSAKPWESFVTDPGSEPNPDLWRTDIFYPIATAVE